MHETPKSIGKLMADIIQILSTQEAKKRAGLRANKILSLSEKKRRMDANKDFYDHLQCSLHTAMAVTNNFMTNTLEHLQEQSTLVDLIKDFCPEKFNSAEMSIRSLKDTMDRQDRELQSHDDASETGSASSSSSLESARSIIGRAEVRPPLGSASSSGSLEGASVVAVEDIKPKLRARRSAAATTTSPLATSPTANSPRKRDLSELDVAAPPLRRNPSRKNEGWRGRSSPAYAKLSFTVCGGVTDVQRVPRK
ncbi:hypothetical protein P7C70_g6056, partial [Phenoliferia sp. Uapishka_3]